MSISTTSSKTKTVPLAVRSSIERIWKIIIVVFGATILLIGIALLVLPGPGWLTIIIGLSILGGEFVWARRLLKKIKQEARYVERTVRKEVKLAEREVKKAGRFVEKEL